MCIFDNRSEKEREEAAKRQMDIFERAHIDQKNTEQFVKSMQEMYKKNVTVFNNQLDTERLQEQLDHLTKGTGKKLPDVLSETIEEFLPDEDQLRVFALDMAENLGYKDFREQSIFVGAYMEGAKEIIKGLTW